MNAVDSDFALQYECDVLVIGAGVAGYCAAIQVGRLGCATILLEKDMVLGGNAGPNVGVGITGADRYNAYGTETGLIHELHEEGAWVQAFTQVSSGSMPYNISRRFEAVVQTALESAGVTVLKQHYARRPVLNAEGRIISVIVEDLAAFQTVRVDINHVLVDASGDGEIAVLAGAEYDVGSEAKSEFNERSAPDMRSSTVQGSSLVAIAQRTGHDVSFMPPPNTPTFSPRLWFSRIASFIHHHDGWFSEDVDLKFLYVTEAGGTLDTVRDDGQIYETLLKQLWAEWNHIKNGPHQQDSRCWDLLWVSPKAGKRESRRLLGDVILTQTDLEAGRCFPDDIAYGGHDLDDHQPIGETADIFGHSIPPLYGIPYRACYSRNVPNLLMAGRLISATHLAHSSTRIMRTGGAIGQAVGIAAALCSQHRCTPRQVYQHHLDQLQTMLLELDGTILHRCLTCGRDIAPNAEVTASSEIQYIDQSPGLWVPLFAKAGALLWDWPSKLQSVELYLRNDSPEDQVLHLELYRSNCEPKWKTIDDYELVGRNDLRDGVFAQCCEVPFTLQSAFEGWLSVDIPSDMRLTPKDAASDDDRLLIAVDENRNVSWALAQKKNPMVEMVEQSHYRNEWRLVDAVPAIRLTPSPSLGEAQNIVNGFHRRFSRGPTNMWISDPMLGMPQDVSFTWSEAQLFDEIRLTFDNLTAFRHDQPWENGTRVLPFLVKAYAVDIWKNGEWHELLNECCNIHRFRCHSFAPVSTHKLRLRILSTHGAGEAARVYQIQILTPSA